MSNGIPSSRFGVLATAPSIDDEAAALRLLAPQLRAFILYEAPVNLIVASILEAQQCLGARETLRRARQRIAAMTTECYGADYPL